MDEEDVGAVINDNNSECGYNYLAQRTLSSKEDLETRNILELLERLDMDIACSSEKLLNMELCITSMSLQEKDSPAMGDSVSEKQTENILVLDLALSYLDSELMELGNFLCCLRLEVVNGKVSCGEHRESLTLLQERQLNAEASLTRVQEKLLEIKKQLGSLQRVLLGFGLESSYMAPEENYVAVKLDDFSPKGLLRMLDKSIAEEIDFENKLLEITQCKEELSSKLFITNQALFSMKMNVEHILSRLYEGEYFAELFKEIAKDMVSQIQILESNLSRSLQQEKVLSSKILEMESALQKSDCNCTKPDLCQPLVINGGDEKEFATNFEELNAWKEKVKVLEEKLKDSGAKLRKEYVSDEDGQFHQYSSEMEDVIESMRHSLFIAESRAESAEAKLVELTESHLELTEELEFLKGSERSGEKISSLEKQVRDLEKELLHANASSEASQEQQNMLYSAIWDMETLIEDLKSKVAKAEMKLEDAEERCLMLAETNSELNKEIDLCKSRGESLEASLKEANRVKVARAKDINGGTKLITDLVMQLSGERERLQEQLHSLARENRILMEELRRMRKNGSETTQNNKIGIDKETCSSVNNNVAGIGGSVEDSRERSSPTSNQVNRSSEEAEMSNEVEEEGSSTCLDNGSEQYDAPMRRHKHEVGKQERAKRELCLTRGYFLMAVLLLLLVIAAGGMTVLYQQEILGSFLSNYMGL